MTPRVPGPTARCYRVPPVTQQLLALPSEEATSYCLLPTVMKESIVLGTDGPADGPSLEMCKR